MKNIHILPTDKPSRLIKHKSGSYHIVEYESHKEGLYNITNQHICITSDEEIKVDEYYLGDDNNIYCLVTTVNYNGKKIILTTDPELIKDGGVQAIDDEFLEWFVNHPSCEFVEIEEKSRCCGRCDGVDDLCYADMTCDDHNTRGCEICYGLRISYNIIIPKEEPNYEVESVSIGEERVDIIIPLLEREETLEETLEQAADNWSNEGTWCCPVSFVEGGKWQAERSYSEEEVYDILFKHTEYFLSSGERMSLTEWFEQYKKK
jgi:hypothetical protein